MSFIFIFFFFFFFFSIFLAMAAILTENILVILVEDHPTIISLKLF